MSKKNKNREIKLDLSKVAGGRRDDMPKPTTLQKIGNFLAWGHTDYR